VAVAIDARFHGGRAETPFAFKNALLRAWKSPVALPAVYALDTVWDLITLIDYLEARPDVDPLNIGVTGIGYVCETRTQKTIEKRLVSAEINADPQPRGA
jgi:hypothetical protein